MEIDAGELLKKINTPADLKRLGQADMVKLCGELRQYIVDTVSTHGGHFAASLNMVELTVALHYVLNTPYDQLVWDVGHQAYGHKILTGRREVFHTNRVLGGISGFTKRCESEYDTFGVGHSSTSISAALGMAVASHYKGETDRQHVAVIGDGAMTAGMAFEALNHAGIEKSNLLVILNDNDMSISNSVSALNKYFTRIWSSPAYSSLRTGSKRMLEALPAAWEFARKTEEHMKGMVAPSTIFEELGFNYYGPLDGHDIDELVATLNNLKQLKGPRILHLVTKKGKGFLPAEEDPIKYHALKGVNAQPSTPGPTYSNIFGEWLCEMAAADKRLMGITPAMREGSDMVRFSNEFPKRYFDVAIAEQHAVTLAAGLACEGAKFVVAIYSTFLQRAYDQLIHDVALQDLDVLFAIDRAGLVGEDGPTHHGVYDLSYLRCIPNMVVMAPSNENECRQMLYTGYMHQGPAAVRYPRGQGVGAALEAELESLPMGKGVIRRQGQKVAFLAFGAPVAQALEVADILDATVADMRFVKPMDAELVVELASAHDLLVTLEERRVGKECR